MCFYYIIKNKYRTFVQNLRTKIIMRKAVLFVVIVCAAMIVVTTGCTNKKPEVVDTPQVATALMDTTVNDSIDSVMAVVEETPMPKAADQLFDDFFFNFMSSKKLQLARTNFPLQVIDGKKTTTIEKKNWKMDHFYRSQDYYTLIFDDEKQMESSKSTEIDSVIVEKIHLKAGKVDQYCFDHFDGKWKLNQIRKVTFDDNHNSSFLHFLPKLFAGNDVSCIKNPLPFYGPDPETGEGDNINTTIPANAWKDYVSVPNDMIYNVLYGQKNKESNQKILTFRGLANGIETQLIFKKKGNRWQLVKINAA